MRTSRVASGSFTVLLVGAIALFWQTERALGQEARGVADSWVRDVRVDLGAREYDLGWQPSPALPGLSPCWQAPNRAHGFRTYFTASGIHVVSRTESVPSWEWSLSVVGIGRAGQSWPVSSATPSVKENRIDLHREEVDEWYDNAARGLEQGFVLRTPPDEIAARDARTPLRGLVTSAPPREDRSLPDLVHVDLALDGALQARFESDGQAIDFATPAGRAVLHYAALLATDARGQLLPAWMEGLSGAGLRGIRLVVNARDAVYPITIDPLVTTPAWTAESDQANCYFSDSIATAGDVNGDGYSDVIVGASYYDNGQTDEGRAYVYLGSASGLSTTPAWIAESNQSGAGFGYPVAPAGDVNGDGYADVLVGANGYDGAQVDGGRAYLYLGSASGLSATPAWTADGDQIGDGFGVALSTAGDVNGDGYADVVVGAWLYDNGQTDEGRVYLYLGSASGLSATASWTAESNQADARFGIPVSTAGDVNGDGYADVIVGAYRYDNGQTDEGRAYVYLGSPSGLAASPAWTAEGDQASAGFGSWVSLAGDVNGDGYGDVIVGAPYYDNGQTDEGRAYVYLGSASGLAASPVWYGEPDQAGAQYGVGVATAGDVNGDGYADIVVGAQYYDNGQTNEGRAWVYLGSASGPSSGPALVVESDQTSAQFGQVVSTAGDVNGDGYSDVLIAAPNFDNGQVDEGRAFLYLGSGSGLTASPAQTVESDQASAFFGWSVASAGDVNGDGYSDVIVGAYGYDNGQSNEGRVFVYLGSSSGLSSTPAWTAESDQTDAELGISVATAGDVNGDGYSDVIVGAPNYSGNGLGSNGRAWVYLGSPAGLSPTAAWTVEGDQTGAVFGSTVATAGDVNADGYSDVVVGAPFYDAGLQDEGRAYLYLGSATGLSQTPSWMATCTQFNAQMGNSLGTAGDVNGDGYSDVVLAAYAFDDGQTDEGRVWVFLGYPLGLEPGPAWFVDSNVASSFFGSSVATAGDVNGDGYSDIVIGAEDYLGSGAAFVYLGSASGLGSSPAWTVESDLSNSLFGASVATAGDVNGDGYSDVVVGAPFYTFGPEGIAYTYLGSASGLSPFPAWQAKAGQFDTLFGSSVAGAGDVNGDGFSDVIVGAYAYDNGQTNEGRAFVYYGGGGDGLDRIPRQARSGSLGPVALLGNADSGTGFHVEERGITAAGRGKIRLQWEAKALGAPFNGAGLGTSTVRQTSAPGATGSSARFDEAVAGLGDHTLYHWRSRIVSSDPFFPRSPWMSLQGDNVTESKVRTTGCVDADGDGHGPVGDTSCASSVPDCNDGDPTIWSVPGETGNLRFTSKTTLTWDVPADPGALTTALLYDTLRSSAAGNFLAAACLESDDGPNTTATDAASPSTGQVFFYLTRAQDACPGGVGSLGKNSAGFERVGVACP